MAFRLKQSLIRYVRQSTESKYNLPDLEKVSLKLAFMKKNKTKIEGVLQFGSIDNSKDIQNNLITALNNFNLQKNQILIGEVKRQINFKNISDNGRELKFEIDKNEFIKDILDSNPTEVVHVPEKKNFLVEFSSPNIAKEFHVGHLRSTMFGNFIANIMEKLGNNVTRINYLGDWGTQFGMLITGIELLGYTEEFLSKDTMLNLNKAYVYANQMAVMDKSIEVKARKIFQKLENGDKELLKKWQQLKEWSKTDLEQLYEKLGVKFNYYDWESSYNIKKAKPLLKDLKERGILFDDEHGRKIVEVDGNQVPLLKSDGTTLYLLRDILAFFDRRKQFKFDKSYYIVDYSQGKHFMNLKRICELIEPGSSDMIEHIQLGRILKMSTRNGTNILLRDVLDEAQRRMYQKQLNTETTKGSPSMDISEILGKSALIIYDFNQGRERHYEFSWEKALSAKSESGIRLQYVHCRLCSLIKNSEEAIATECDPSSLKEPEAIRLILDIARFEEAVHATGRHLEPTILLSYLFELTISINNAIGCLSVKKSDSYTASQRLYLFNTSRLIIAEGLRLLGLPALEEM